jgi:hypothetical protein
VDGVADGGARGASVQADGVFVAGVVALGGVAARLDEGVKRLNVLFEAFEAIDQEVVMLVDALVDGADELGVHGRPPGEERINSKFEARNSKQIRMTEIPMIKNGE